MSVEAENGPSASRWSVSPAILMYRYKKKTKQGYQGKNEEKDSAIPFRRLQNATHLQNQSAYTTGAIGAIGWNDANRFHCITVRLVWH